MDVLVTGTSSGIGAAIARAFLDEGHRVWGVDIAPASIEHPSYVHVQADITAENLPELPEPDESPVLAEIPGGHASARNGAEFPQYVASKAGIVGYMKNLALALAPRGITCNAISPGGVITPANKHILDDEELYRQVLDETLLGKWAQPEEIAELAYYLTVHNCSITGEDILVDNGEMLKSNFIW